MCVTENKTKSSRRLVSQSVGEISLVFLSFFSTQFSASGLFVFFRPVRTVNRRRSCILIYLLIKRVLPAFFLSFFQTELSSSVQGAVWGVGCG